MAMGKVVVTVDRGTIGTTSVTSLSTMSSSSASSGVVDDATWSKVLNFYVFDVAEADFYSHSCMILLFYHLTLQQNETH